MYYIIIRIIRNDNNIRKINNTSWDKSLPKAATIF